MSCEYDGVTYNSEWAANRDAVYAWCAQYGESPGEQAVYVDSNLNEVCMDMAEEWEIPFLEPQDWLTCRELLHAFVSEQQVIV